MEIQVLKKKLQPLFREHKIEKAILFGSFARNEASRHSDIDLILIKNTHLRFLDKFYIPTRYPNGLPDLTPGQVYFSQDSVQAIEKATFFLEETRKLMES